MQDAPKVSVLMTYFNKGTYVGEAIQSVLSQTCSDLELIVVDDGSTDGGMEIVRAFRDDRVRILVGGVNAGRAASANRGYDAARGDYVAVLDADDRMHPERIARQVEFMDRNGDIGVCSSALKAFGSDNSVIVNPASDAEIRADAMFGIRLAYPGCMIRRSVLEEHGIRCDPNWLLPGMDHLFLLKIMLRTRCANLAEALTEYRVGPQNMAFGRDRISDRTALARETMKELGIPFTEDELSLHMMLFNIVTDMPDRRTVRGLREWLARLVEWNHRSGTFDHALFISGLQMRWDRLFHPLADRDFLAALEHIRLSGVWSIARMRYLLGSLVSRSREGSKGGDPSVQAGH